MQILKSKSEVKVTVTQGWYVTLHHPKMHPLTKFWIPTSNSIKDRLRTGSFKKLGQRSRPQCPKNAIQHLAIPRCSHSPNLGFPPQRILKICTRLDANSRNYVRGQGHIEPNMVRDTLTSQDATTHQIWDSSPTYIRDILRTRLF